MSQLDAKVCSIIDTIAFRAAGYTACCTGFLSCTGALGGEIVSAAAVKTTAIAGAIGTPIVFTIPFLVYLFNKQRKKEAEQQAQVQEQNRNTTFFRWFNNPKEQDNSETPEQEDDGCCVRFGQLVLAEGLTAGSYATGAAIHGGNVGTTVGAGVVGSNILIGSLAILGAVGYCVIIALNRGSNMEDGQEIGGNQIVAVPANKLTGVKDATRFAEIAGEEGQAIEQLLSADDVAQYRVAAQQVSLGSTERAQDTNTVRQPPRRPLPQML